MAKKQKGAKQGIANEKLCAILSYLIIGIIWFFADKKMSGSSFSKFHVKQAIILVILDVIAWAISGIPIIGWIAAPILYLIVIILMIIGIINAANGKESQLPIIGEFSQKLNF